VPPPVPMFMNSAWCSGEKKPYGVDGRFPNRRSALST
jgi:hypothetical protein